MHKTIKYAMRVRNIERMVELCSKTKFGHIITLADLDKLLISRDKYLDLIEKNEPEIVC